MTRNRILIVEDEPLIRMDMADLVADLGFEPVEVSNADEAVQILMSDTTIVAVVTDVDMPGSMDGQQLARFVRDRWPPCRLIVVSGRRMLTERDLPPGAVFLSKPVPSSRLALALEHMGLRA